MINFKLASRRSLKYLIMTIVVALSCKFIPTGELQPKEIMMIACIAAVTFAVVDLYSP